MDEHRFAVLVATLQYAFEGHRDLRMSQQRARALARPERGGAVGVHEDDQVEPSPRYRSGALALGAAKGFEFGFERRPISAVLGLFGADLGIEGFAKGVAGARQSEPEQGRRLDRVWASLGKRWAKLMRRSGVRDSASQNVTRSDSGSPPNAR